MNQKDQQRMNNHNFQSQIFNELISNEIREVLLVSSLYNIFNLEEDGSLAAKLMNEYKGLNIGPAPRISGVSSAGEALSLMKRKKFDMALLVPNIGEMSVFELGREFKKINQNLPVILLVPFLKEIYAFQEKKLNNGDGIDKIFVWCGNPDLLLALIKNVEDHLNAEHDTQHANARIIMLVEDSTEYSSYFLPLIYKEIVQQTQSLLKVGLNEKQRLLTIQARPKVLLAQNYETAVELYEKYKSCLLCIISDAQFARKGKIDDAAGIELLSQVRKEDPHIPLLLMSSEPENNVRAGEIPSLFLNKNSKNLSKKIHHYFLEYLSFGDFVFRMSDGHEIDRAPNLLMLEKMLTTIPAESISYHADRNHFSNWLMARSEITLAMKFRTVKTSDFSDVEALRTYIISNIHAQRKWRQKGIVSDFDRNHFDSDVREFLKIGRGSLGGKARGLAFMSLLFQRYGEIQNKYPGINIKIPKTLVICTDVFESFVADNDLQVFAGYGFNDEEVTEAFLNAEMPAWIVRMFETYLSQVKFPLAVRSSSQLEDFHFQPSAGLYSTYMIPNNHPELSTRLSQLIKAVKLVFASTYYEDPKVFTRNTSIKSFHEMMGVIIQEVAGVEYGDFFYPAVSGVVQSYNFYPFSYMKPEEGIAHIALGLGKTVMEGEKCLRFSPKYPNVIPQFSSVQDILENAQRYFYALKIRDYPEDLNFHKYSNLEKRELDDAKDESPVKFLSSTYIPDEDRIRDTWYIDGPKVITFAQLLNHKSNQIPKLLSELMELGSRSMGCPVEIEFSVNIYPEENRKWDFHFLQIRPMAAHKERFKVQITDTDVQKAICRSTLALGNGINETISDIVYVKPDIFSSEETVRIAGEINKINAQLLKENRTYLMIGPGRWGASDRWLGIPVKWHNISGVGAIIELRNEKINADPSQGSHFFHNITSLGITYITVNEITGQKPGGFSDYFDWQWIASIPAVSETTFIRHVRLAKPVTIKIDGKTSQCVIIRP